MQIRIEMKNPKSGKIEAYQTSLENEKLFQIVFSFWKKSAHEILTLTKLLG